MDASPLQWKHKAKSVSPPRKAAKVKLQPRLRPSRKDRAAGESQGPQPPAFAEHLVSFVWGLGGGGAADDEGATQQEQLLGQGEVAQPRTSAPPAAGTTPQKAPVSMTDKFGCFATPLPHGPGRGDFVPSPPIAYNCSSTGVPRREQEQKWRTCNIANMCEDEDEVRLTSSQQGDFVHLRKGNSASSSWSSSPWRAV